MVSFIEKRLEHFTDAYSEEAFMDPEDLREHYKDKEAEVIQWTEERLPRWITWLVDLHSYHDLYQESVDVMIETVGDDMVREFQLYLDSEGKTGKEEMRELVEKHYGSVQGLRNYGEGLKEAGRKQRELLEKHMTGVIGKYLLKPALNRKLSEGYALGGAQVEAMARELERD